MFKRNKPTESWDEVALVILQHLGGELVQEDDCHTPLHGQPGEALRQARQRPCTLGHVPMVLPEVECHAVHDYQLDLRRGPGAT